MCKIMCKIKFIKSVLFVLMLVSLQNCQVRGFSIVTSAKGEASRTTTKVVNAIEAKEAKEEELTVLDHSSTVPPTSALLEKCDPCPENIMCVPQIQCPAHVRMSDHEKPQTCDLPGDEFGFCCVTGQNHTGLQKEHKERTPFAGFLPMSIVEEARQKFEKLMHDVAAMPVQRGHPDFLHGIVFHSPPHDEKMNFHIANTAMQQIIATQVFSKKEQIPMDDLMTNNVQVDFKKTPLGHHCSQPPVCREPHSRYRNFDGSCNNPLPQRTHYGAAGQPMERLLPPSYEDGIWMPRAHGVDGAPLKGARETSRILLSDISRPHPKCNLLIMQFGQFIAHDVSQSASVRLENGDLVECCTNTGSAELPPEKRHFACLPIPVEADDEFYKDFKVRCMNFVRLSLAPNFECKVGYGKQRSKVTHFLDASTVYGSSRDTANDLREFNGGRLKMFNDFGRELLPMTNDKKVCGSEEPGQTCYQSGDGRTNQIISLIVVHIIFAREHNRIAGILAQLNPHYTDERLFQETRRIVIAELQHITYNEYLPAVVGPKQMKRFRLTPKHHGYASDYNAEVNPAITNEFSGAAFRMGHSSVDGKYNIQKSYDHKNIEEIIEIPDVMFNPSRMRKRPFYDELMLTMMAQPMQRVDSSITHGLSRYLFRSQNPFGLDLAAFNIQRGRDQGLRCYNDYLELMGHKKIRDFKKFSPEISAKLSKIYRSPDDIDLWIGGLLEKSVEDGIVGITFAEIIADQFSRFKAGDRYFYEYNSKINPGAFTLNQLHEIRKVTMARLICDNADHLALLQVPPQAFVRSDFPHNEPISCDHARIPIVDLGAWRDK